MLPDTVVGHYRILRPLGKGGMGEVYAAEDTRLHRTVALKVLPETMAHDQERRKRFEREAQAVAALNHPSIVTIHSVEEAAGVMFLTMEAVEGQTLKEILEAGALPLERLLRIGTAISDALAAAHHRGITHRDLKPANVMVTPDGRVKVLDFGLAKLREAAHDLAAEQPTKLHSGDLTGEGRIIGTVAYMSPEQAEGKPIDQRSDIFSAGVMLHEMSAGERPFKGDTDISVISSILKDNPSSITDLKPELPSGLARIVRRCLAKDPERRYQTAGDLRNDLEELKQDLDSGVLTGVSGHKALTHTGEMRSGHKALTHKWVIAAGLAVVALALVAAVVYMWLQRDEGEAADAPVFVPDEIARLTDTGNAGMAAISADGRYVAHVKLEQNMPGLWMRQTATTSDVRIVAPERVRYDGVTFSPDGNYIYYVTYPLSLGVGSLYRVPTLGGAPIRVLEDIDSAPAFSPDGERFAFARGEPARGVTHLMIAGVDGSNARSVAAPSGELRMTNDTPAWSSDGRTILVTLTKSRLSTEVVAVDAETGALTTVGEPWLYARGPQWLAGGRAFVVEGLTTMAVGMPQLWEVAYPSGQRRRLTNDLNGYRWVSASAGGKQLAAVQATREGAIWLVPANGGAGTRLSLGASRSVGFDGIDWTPDGRLVFTANIGGLSHIWIANPDGTGLRQLTSGDKYSTNPAVSPDGRWIYFTADAGDKMRIWRMGIDGSEQRAITDVLQDLMPLPSPDGEWVYFTAPAEGLNRVMRMRPDGSERTEIGKGPMFAYDISADGTEILGTAWNQERRRTECAIMPASGGVPRLLGDMALADGGMVSTCRWNPEPGVVTYAAQRNGVMNVYARPVAGGPERQLTRFTADGTPTMYSGSWSRDGRLAVTRGRETSDVVLIQSR